MRDDIKSSILDAMRILLRDRLGKAKTIVPGLHFSCEVLEQPHKFQDVYDLLADDESRKVLTWLIKYKFAYLILQSRDEAEILFPPRISRGEWHLMSQQVNQIPEHALEENIEIDVIENFLLDGYNLVGICGVEPGDVVLDLGAFNGNSSIVFARAAGPDGKVYAFEPNPTMQDVLARNLAKASCSNVEIVPRGAAEKSAVLKFKVQGAGSRIDPTGQVEVPVGRIDNFVVERGFTKVDFLKFDIEGFEMPALRGAASTIRTFRPKLAISVYHLHYDIHAVTLFIQDICPWYKFYLRHNAMHDGEIVLFCQPLDRVRTEHKIAALPLAPQ
jgi:FkbM family methyltransferase